MPKRVAHIGVIIGKSSIHLGNPLRRPSLIWEPLSRESGHMLVRLCSSHPMNMPARGKREPAEGTQRAPRG